MRSFARQQRAGKSTRALHRGTECCLERTLGSDHHGRAAISPGPVFRVSDNIGPLSYARASALLENCRVFANLEGLLRALVSGARTFGRWHSLRNTGPRKRGLNGFPSKPLNKTHIGSGELGPDVDAARNVQAGFDPFTYTACCGGRDISQSPALLRAERWPGSTGDPVHFPQRSGRYHAHLDRRVLCGQTTGALFRRSNPTSAAVR